MNDRTPVLACRGLQKTYTGGPQDVPVLLGVVAGVLLANNIDVVVPAIERLFNVQFLDKSVYYISDLPSDLQWADVTTVAGIALALALVATLYPAWRAARVNPAAALRYE